MDDERIERLVSHSLKAMTDLREAVALLRQVEWSLNETATRTGRCPLCVKVNGRDHDPTCRLAVFLRRMKGRV